MEDVWIAGGGGFYCGLQAAIKKNTFENFPDGVGLNKEKRKWLYIYISRSESGLKLNKNREI